MLKFAGSVVAGGVLGGVSLAASGENSSVFLPAIVATVGFVGAMSLFNSLEPPVVPAATAATAAAAAPVERRSRGEKKPKKPFVRTGGAAVAPAPAPVASPSASEVSEPEEPASAASDGEDSEAERLAKEKAKKKKAKEAKAAKKAAAAAAAATPAPAPAPAPEAAKQEGKKKGKKAAKEPEQKKEPEKKTKEPKAEEKKKKPKKTEEKKEEKKTKAAEEKKGKAEGKKKGEEKKGEEKKSKGEEKKVKKEEKKKAKVESDDETGDDDGWAVVRPTSRKSAANTKEEDLTEEELAKPVQQEVKISLKSIPAIIGANGDTLHRLQESSGARVQMPKKDSGSEIVVVSGPLKAVLQAKRLLKEIEQKGFSAATHPGQTSSDLTLKDDKQKGLIIGKNGAHLRAIQTATNTRITMPPTGSVSLKVSISGTKENVKRAKQEIRALLAEGYSPLTHPTYIKKEIAFPQDQLRTLIGKKGQNIKHIQAVSKGARINTPRDQGDIVSVVGTPEQVALAEREILRLIAPVEDVAPPADSPWSAPDSGDYNEDDAWA